MNTETISPAPPKAEQRFGREHLTHEQLRREFARVALLAMLMQEFERVDNDPLFRSPDYKTTRDDNPTDFHAELLGLLSHAIMNGRLQQKRDNYPFGNINWNNSYYESGLFSSKGAGSKKPDFATAPSMADKPLGPELPNLAYGDRIHDWGKRRPTDADFAAADRANDMYRSALFKHGWRGGEVTEEQRRHARTDMTRTLHPDLNGGQPVDVGALNVINSHFDHLKREAARTVHKESPFSASESDTNSFGHAETNQDSQPETTESTGFAETSQDTPKTPLELTAAPEHPPIEHSNGESGSAGS